MVIIIRNGFSRWNSHITKNKEYLNSKQKKPVPTIALITTPNDCIDPISKETMKKVRKRGWMITAKNTFNSVRLKIIFVVTLIMTYQRKWITFCILTWVKIGRGWGYAWRHSALTRKWHPPIWRYYSQNKRKRCCLLTLFSPICLVFVDGGQRTADSHSLLSWFVSSCVFFHASFFAWSDVWSREWTLNFLKHLFLHLSDLCVSRDFYHIEKRKRLKSSLEKVLPRCFHSLSCSACNLLYDSVSIFLLLGTSSRWSTTSLLVVFRMGIPRPFSWICPCSKQQ